MISERKVKIPIYEFTLKVTIFDDKEEVISKYPTIFNSSTSGCTIEYENESRCHLILPIDKIDTIIHELEHAKSLIWKYIGYTPQVDNDEPDAYLMSYMYEQVEKIIKKHLVTKC